MDELYEKIKELRLKKGLTQAELARRTGYNDRSSITKLENGHFDLSIDKVKIFAQVLGTTPAYLMGWEDDEKLDSLIGMIENGQDRISKIAERISSYTDEELDELENYLSFIETKRG